MTVLLIFQVVHNQELANEMEVYSQNVESADIMRSEVASLYIAISHFAGDPLEEFDKDYESTKENLVNLQISSSKQMPYVDWENFLRNITINTNYI